jgi:hypothetical protein
VAQAETASTMTAQELTRGIRRAHFQYGQEMAAATDEYDEARRKIAAVRRERSTAARAERDRQIADLREQFRREQRGEGAP